MGKVRVDVVRPGAAAPERLAFDINGDSPDFEIATERLSNWSVGEVDGRLLDFLDIAGAVFATDGMVLRGGRSRPHLGAGWSRRLDFEIAVRDPAFWRRAAIRHALKDTIEFLTEDAVTFDFVQDQTPPPKQHYLQFTGSRSNPFAADHVVLFSGGLDSLAGALETLSNETGRVVLVTHRSAQKNATRQDRLAKALQSRFPGRVSYIPIAATRKGARSRETTQRSRSLLFAAFGYVIARIVGARRLSFFENGVVSHNLPLSPQIIGAMATRTTHPFTLRKFADLLSLIDGKPFEVRNPFQWMIKREVVEKIRDHDETNLIADTVSCNHVWKRTADQSHCGACSQCLDRRFGILGAGLAEYDPETGYQTPILVGERLHILSKTEALEWTRHALRLIEMPAESFQERFGGDIARIARGHPDLAAGDVLKRCLALQARHGANVRRVLKDELRVRAGEIFDRSMPTTSLFRMVLNDLTSIAEVRETDYGVVAQLQGDGEAADEDRDGDRMVVVLHEVGSRRSFKVHGMGEVDGAPAGPVFALRPYYDEDRAAGMTQGEHRHIPGKRLIPVAGATPLSVAQNVKRCRAQLAKLYTLVNGVEPAEPLLIQNRHGRGYRLDPAVVIIDERTDRP